jgi:hypothetical protein
MSRAVVGLWRSQGALPLGILAHSIVCSTDDFRVASMWLKLLGTAITVHDLNEYDTGKAGPHNGAPAFQG